MAKIDEVAQIIFRKTNSVATHTVWEIAKEIDQLYHPKPQLETYTLNCVKCDSPFTSREAFPTPQLCPNCIATIPKIPHSKRTVIPTVFNTGKVPKPEPNLMKALNILLPDDSGLLTDEEIESHQEDIGNLMPEFFDGAIWGSRQQHAKDQAHLKKEIGSGS